ncbi:alpha/beta fold hydrolase [Mycobacterium sp. 1423905.2]|uniref:alpha/beta fold hydrolase n=1 Tax=Mycobacterium sp. 1423905.2 TaxID=1856859 RepID=UPI0007FFF8F2|nr:alpha/beta hydrolase [Mycobacterium sp. 1423905.2]OBJ48503.1 salicylate esterase [Mycobacterium sp. 1423905.2]
MTTYVLVHGAWHDGSCWNQVIKRLEFLGHTAFAPTAAGHGKGVDKRVSHADSTRSIVDFIVDTALTDIVLVGHSFGGTVISKVAEAIPGRIRRLVFYAGFVLDDGDRLVDNVPPDHAKEFASLAAESPDATVMLPFRLWREVFMNDAGLELARSCYERLSPQPSRLFSEPLNLKKFYALDIPRSYLLPTEDSAIVPGEWGWHRFPKMADRLGLHRMLRMPGGHEGFFTNPHELANRIIDAGRD